LFIYYPEWQNTTDLPLNNNKKGDKMFVEERQQKILKLLNEKKRITVEELINKFSVSEVTIRKDLNTLRKKNLLKRTYGGAIVSRSMIDVPTFEKRKVINKKIKEKLGRKAIELIEENETIMIDSGTTTFEIAKRLKVFNSLTIITNALDVCTELINHNSIKVISTGGEINKNNLSMSGLATKQVLSKYRANKAFIGVSALSLDHGFTTSDEQIARAKNQMMKSSNKVVVISDSSKFDKVSFSKICDYDKIDILITDDGISEEYLNAFKEKNIRVYLVSK